MIFALFLYRLSDNLLILMHAAKWSLVLHGGCADTKPDFEHRSDVSHELDKVISAASISASEGKKAKDIVVEIIAALEDYPLFNAGRGATLTSDGAHEVRMCTDAKFAFRYEYFGSANNIDWIARGRYS